MPAHLRLIAALLLAATSACADADRGLAAYRAGNYAEASRDLGPVAEAAGSDASVALAFDAALAAVRAGDPVAARSRLRQAWSARGAEGAVDELTFLEGVVGVAEAEVSAAQARSVESEPFAWDIAIGTATSAMESFRKAAASRDDWPAARRNAERARLMVLAFRREKAASDPAGRKASTPEVRLIPKDTAQGESQPDPSIPGEPGGQEGDAAAEDAARIAELAPEDLPRLLEILGRKDEEKRTLRKEARSARSAGVEKDW